MLAEHGYARFASVCDTYVDSTFSSSRAMIDSRLDTLSTDRNWSICEKFQIYRMYEALELMPRNPFGPMPGSSSRFLSFHSTREKRSRIHGTRTFPHVLAAFACFVP